MLRVEFIIIIFFCIWNTCGCVGWVPGEQHKSLFQSVRSGDVRVIDLFEHLLAGVGGGGWEHGSHYWIYCG